MGEACQHGLLTVWLIHSGADTRVLSLSRRSSRIIGEPLRTLRAPPAPHGIEGKG